MAEQLRYPLSELNKDDDFIKFSIYTYKRGTKDINFFEEAIFNPASRDNGYKKPDEIKTEYDHREKTIANTTLIGGAVQGVPQGSITLPIPSQISDTNSTKFGESSLNSFYAAAISRTLDITGASTAEEFVKSIGTGAVDAAKVAGSPEVAAIVRLFTAQQAISTLGANVSFDQLFARTTGSIINPNMELLFSGPSLRNFKFQFKMTPREQPEAEACKKIIRKFKKSMSPVGGNNIFLDTPNIFKLSYMTGNQKHKFLNKFKLCALTDMSVNYTGEGNYATYDEGAPVSMIMDLSFTEMSPIYAEDYKEDVGGVGY